MMCVVYVDDTIFGARTSRELEVEITSLGISTKDHDHTFILRNEGSVSAFLGIQIEKLCNQQFSLTQTGLIDKILLATGLEDCNGCHTPVTAGSMGIDEKGENFDDNWEYASIIGMLLYLANNTRPDIAYGVHQAARFTHNPKNSHAAGVKRIIRYLKQTRTKGLFLKPSSTYTVDCYVDSDFAGLFSSEDKTLPISVKSRTGYVIFFRDAPLMWVSKLQTQIALSTMEAEYIALSQAMRDLIPIREIIKEVLIEVFKTNPTILYSTYSKAFEDVTEQNTNLHVIPQSTVYEDNAACLKFAQLPRITPRTKHIGIPYHWFRSQVEELQIVIQKIGELTIN